MSNREAQVLETTSSELLQPSEEIPASLSALTDERYCVMGPHEIDPHMMTLLKDKYEVKRRIGSGAQGDIYEGLCLKTGNRVAIKQLRVDSAKNWKQYDLFDREAKVLESLNISGTAKFYEAVQNLDGESPMSVIVQEYIDGRSLQSYLSNGERFSFEQSCGILKNLIEVLEKLHKHEPPVIHRDIKPSNILLRFDNDKHAVIPEVFIIDFGAVANPQVQTGGSTVTGTYGYMAPEQLVGTPTPASDIYAFAMVAVYLFSGTPPEKIETKELRVLIEPHLEHLPYIVTVFLRKMLETTPGNRLIDYRLIAQTLEQFGKQKFDVQFSDEQAVAQTQKYQLNDVKSLGQAGNIALWQALPENAPRPLPKEYRKKFDNLSVSNDSNQIFISDRVFDDGDEDFPKEFYVFLIAILFLLGFIMLLLSIPWIAVYMAIAIALVGSCLIVTLVMKFVVLGKNEGYHRLPHTKSILSCGRKTLATVEKIRLLPSESAAFYILQTSALQNAKSEKDFRKLSKNLNTHVRPIWEVVYAFNPPDDKDPEPLHHRYYSTKPIDDLVVGDVLPILYYYDFAKDMVYSMPYPLPIDAELSQCPDLVSADEVYVDSSRY